MKLPQMVLPSEPVVGVALASRAIAAPLNPVMLSPSIVQPGVAIVRPSTSAALICGTVDLDGDRRDVGLLVVERVGREQLRRVVGTGPGLAVAVDHDRHRDRRQGRHQADRLQSAPEDQKIDLIGRRPARDRMSVRVCDRITDRADGRIDRLIGRARDEEGVDGLGRPREFGCVAVVQAEDGRRGRQVGDGGGDPGARGVRRSRGPPRTTRSD